MSTAEYVSRFITENGWRLDTSSYAGGVLNHAPAAQYDPSVPLCVEDANPEYVPGVDDVPIKVKRTRKVSKPVPDKSAVMWLLMDHGLTMYQANPLTDKLIALFGGDA